MFSVLTLAPPPVRHGAAIRHQRAAPSPTPARAADEKGAAAIGAAAPSPPHTAVTPFSPEQVSCPSGAGPLFWGIIVLMAIN